MPGLLYFRVPPSVVPGSWVMDPFVPTEAPEPPPTPRALRQDMFTAILLPAGAISGLIVLFAFWTSGRLVIPGLGDGERDNHVVFLGLRLGTTESLPLAVWAIGFLLAFMLAGSSLGFIAGKFLGRLTQWGT